METTTKFCRCKCGCAFLLYPGELEEGVCAQCVNGDHYVEARDGEEDERYALQEGDYQ